MPRLNKRSFKVTSKFPNTIDTEDIDICIYCECDGEWEKDLFIDHPPYEQGSFYCTICGEKLYIWDNAYPPGID